MPFPTVEPVILPRPGTFATFGISEIGAFTIPANFILLPSNPIVLSDGFEAAWLYLFKRLNPYNTEPRQLRGQRNDGTAIAIQAVLRITSGGGDRSVNERLIDFVAVMPFWTSTAASTASGTF